MELAEAVSTGDSADTLRNLVVLELYESEDLFLFFCIAYGK
jgi:hypothetical protein